MTRWSGWNWTPEQRKVSRLSCLKGQCHEIFCFRFFSWITFPQAPDNNIRINSNFFENSRRYSQVKVHHRCQRHQWQICHRCQRYRRQICRQCQRRRWQIATGINDTGGKLPPVSLTPMANNGNNIKTPESELEGKNLYICFLYYPKVTNQNYEKFSDWRFFPFTTGVFDTGGKPWAANISANFWKKFETVLLEYSGAWGKRIHEKNQKQKILWHCPFKRVNYDLVEWVELNSWTKKSIEVELLKLFCRLNKKICSFLSSILKHWDKVDFDPNA